MEPLNASQATALLEVARRDRVSMPSTTLCLVCGLRQGEALALRWQDVDLDAGTLRVNRQLQRVRWGAATSPVRWFSPSPRTPAGAP